MKFSIHEDSTDLAALTAGVPDRWMPSLTPPPARERKAPSKVECGFAGCNQPWSRLWRRNGRPGFDGRWGCSRNCLRGLIEAAVRREMSDADTTSVASPHRHRVPLGLVLLAQGWITHPQLQHALAAQRAAGRGRIGDWLIEECGVDQEQVTRGLGVQWNRPVLAPTGFDARLMALVMPRALREASRVLPLRLAADRILYLGFEDGVDPAVALAVERMTGLQVESGLMSAEDYSRSEVRLRERQSVECENEIVATLDALTLRMAAALSASQPVDARLVRVGDQYWMRMWLEPAATAEGSRLPRTGEDVVDRLYDVSSTAHLDD